MEAKENKGTGRQATDTANDSGGDAKDTGKQQATQTTSTAKQSGGGAKGANGNGASAAAAAQGTGDLVSDTASAFERARTELNEAIARLREQAAGVDVGAAGVRARSWVEENPTLSVAIAVGAGMLVGKALTSAFTPEPPPTLRTRAEREARRLAKEARDLREALASRATVAGGAIAATAAGVASQASHRAKEISHNAAEKAADFGEYVTDYAAEVGKSVDARAREARKELKKQSKHARKTVRRGADFSDSVLTAARTAVAAVVVKKLSDWSRRFA